MDDYHPQRGHTQHIIQQPTNLTESSIVEGQPWQRFIHEPSSSGFLANTSNNHLIVQDPLRIPLVKMDLQMVQLYPSIFKGPRSSLALDLGLWGIDAKMRQPKSVCLLLGAPQFFAVLKGNQKEHQPCLGARKGGETNMPK